MFEKFSVIDLIKTRSASVCTFAGNIVKFNVQTAQELHFPEYIQFLIEPKSKQFAIRACKEDAPNAVRFSKPEGAQKAQIKISNATVVDMVRKLMDWNAEDNWNVVFAYSSALSPLCSFSERLGSASFRNTSSMSMGGKEAVTLSQSISS